MDYIKSNRMNLVEATYFRLPQAYPSSNMKLEYRWDKPMPHYPPSRILESLGSGCETCVSGGKLANCISVSNDPTDYYRKDTSCYFAMNNAYKGKRFSWD
jgi:hypothetical protein